MSSYEVLTKCWGDLNMTLGTFVSRNRIAPRRLSGEPSANDVGLKEYVNRGKCVIPPN